LLIHSIDFSTQWLVMIATRMSVVLVIF